MRTLALGLIKFWYNFKFVQVVLILGQEFTLIEVTQLFFYIHRLAIGLFITIVLHSKSLNYSFKHTEKHQFQSKFSFFSQKNQ